MRQESAPGCQKRSMRLVADLPICPSSWTSGRLVRPVPDGRARAARRSPPQRRQVSRREGHTDALRELGERFTHPLDSDDGGVCRGREVGAHQRALGRRRDIEAFIAARVQRAESQVRDATAGTRPPSSRIDSHAVRGVRHRALPVRVAVARDAFAVGAVCRTPSNLSLELCADARSSRSCGAALKRRATGLQRRRPVSRAGARFSRRSMSSSDACDGFLRRAALRASLTADERREILRGMILTRATDNRLKTFFTSGEVRYGDATFRAKGSDRSARRRSTPPRIRLRRGDAYRRRTEWRGDVIAPMIRDLGVVLAMRPAPRRSAWCSPRRWRRPDRR